MRAEDEDEENGGWETGKGLGRRDEEDARRIEEAQREQREREEREEREERQRDGDDE